MMAGEADSKVSNLQNQSPNLIQPLPVKKKRNLPGTPDPEAEVVALSPRTLLATNRFLCEICGKGFQRDQNLQLHRRGHNLPWKLKQRSGKDQAQAPPRKRVYVCPEPSCVHHNPRRALGDLTGIKKHFSRKHGEKKWKCDRCSKRYAVQSDWKAHSKTCGTREYRCDCGVLFSRRDSFITHRAFCDALAEETARTSAAAAHKLQTNIDYILQHGSYSSQHLSPNFNPNLINHEVAGQQQAPQRLSLWMSQGAHEISTASPLISNDAGSCISDMTLLGSNSDAQQFETRLKWSSTPGSNFTTSSLQSVPCLLTSLHQNPAGQPSHNMSATALLQKAALVGVKYSAIDPFTGSSEGSPCQNATNSAVNGSKFYRPYVENSMSNVVDGFAVSNHSASTDDVYFTRSKNLLKDYLGGGTRDFLGVGMSTLCQPSVNGWI